LRAGRSAWNDRHVGIVEVAGSNPAPSTVREPRSFRIFNVIWQLKREGYSPRTLEGYSKRLLMLSKHVNLDCPEAVKQFIATRTFWSNAYKESVVNAYSHYVKFHGLKWSKPVYKRGKRLPNVPTTEQVNMIIAHAGRKYALVFSILRDTGLRPIELHRLTLRNIDLEKGVIYPSTAKSGSARALKLKPSTLAMLKEYLARNNYKINDNPFPKPSLTSQVFRRIRNRLSQRLHKPELQKIRLYDLRHYFATMLYHKTKDILHVKEQLGHKRLENTLIYTHLLNFRSDEWVCRVARNATEAAKLVEAGFEYVCTHDNIMLFRKPK